MIKNIWAVIAGFLTVVILSIGTDFIFESLHIFPPQTVPYNSGLLLVALAYRTVFTVLGGYVTARLAPHNPMRFVTILGILGTIAGIGGIFAGWNLSEHWYPIALAVLAFPSVWLGGKLKK